MKERFHGSYLPLLTDLIQKFIQLAGFGFGEVAEYGIHLFFVSIYFSQKFFSFCGNAYIHQALVILAYIFLCKSLQYKPVNNTAGIAHFIQHAFPDLQGGDRGPGTSQYAEDIELLTGDPLFFKKGFHLFIHPVVGVDEIDDPFLMIVPERLLADVFFDADNV